MSATPKKVARTARELPLREWVKIWFDRLDADRAVSSDTLCLYFKRHIIGHFQMTESSM